MVRSVDVARHLDVSKPSVCHAVSTLKAGGFLIMDENSFLFLTDIGREAVSYTHLDVYKRQPMVCARTLQPGHGDPPTPHSSVVWMSPVSGSIVAIVFRARP